MKISQIIATAVIVLVAASGARAAQFAPGDLFVSVNVTRPPQTPGTVQWRDATGHFLKATLATGVQGNETGSAFDSAGNFLVTDFNSGTVTLFDNFGAVGNRSAPGGQPECIVFDTAGNFYVSDARQTGATGIKKFDAPGHLIATILPGVRVDWMELGAGTDQCTLYYTQEGQAVKRVNVCTGIPMSDFGPPLTGPSAFAIKRVPSGPFVGQFLVADWDNVTRLDANGNFEQKYTVPPNTVPPPASPVLFALALGTDGLSFWVGAADTGDVFKYDMAHDTILDSFNAVNGVGVGGLAVYPTNVPPCQPPVIIAGWPQDTSVCLGNTATLQVFVKGSYPMTFQWQKYVNSQWQPVSGPEFSGAQTATLTISQAGAADAGQYRVQITNPCGGPVTSRTALLTTVQNAPQNVTIQPQSVSPCPGETVTFTGTSDGSAPLTYQWSLNGVNLPADPRISGSQTATLTITGVIPSDAGTYQLTVANACGSANGTAPLNIVINNNFTCINVQFSAIEYYGMGGPAAVQFANPQQHLSDRWNIIYGWSGTSAVGSHPLRDIAGVCTPVTIAVDSPTDATYTFTQAPVTAPGLLRGGLTAGEYEDMWILLHNVPAGTYDLYMYGTGGTIDTYGPLTWSSSLDIYYPSQNGPLLTSCSLGWDINTWVEGNQYIVFRGAHFAGDDVYLHIQPDYTCSPYMQPLLNGLQLVVP